MWTIAEMRAKSKAFMDRVPDGVLTAVVVILGCSLSFGLGIMTARDTREGEVRIEELAQINTLPAAVAASQALPEEPPAALPAGGQYVASKTGKSYHLPWCAGAKQIKEANKIYFATKAEAEARGYAPAKNCKGI